MARKANAKPSHRAAHSTPPSKFAASKEADASPTAPSAVRQTSAPPDCCSGLVNAQQQDAPQMKRSLFLKSCAKLSDKHRAHRANILCWQKRPTNAHRSRDADGPRTIQNLQDQKLRIGRAARLLRRNARRSMTVSGHTDQTCRKRKRRYCGSAPSRACRKYGVTTERSDLINSNGSAPGWKRLAGRRQLCAGGHDNSQGRTHPRRHG